MKEIKILHLFPRLLSLYGEYGNIAVLRRTLEENGYTVDVDGYEFAGQSQLLRFFVREGDLVLGNVKTDPLLQKAFDLL